MPELSKPRTADSLPAPGPFKFTSHSFIPRDIAAFAASWAATVAANAEDFRDPVKFAFPAEDQAMTFPARSVTETIVLLKVALTWTMPAGTFLMIFFFTLTGFFVAAVVAAVFFAADFAVSCLAKGTSPIQKLDFLIRNGFSLSFSRTRISTCALPSDGKTYSVPHASITVDAYETLDIVLHLSSEVAFHHVLRLQNAIQLGNII